jgi:hypothetical protein
VSVQARAESLTAGLRQRLQQHVVRNVKGFMQLHISKARGLADVLQDLGSQGRCVHLYPFHERPEIANHRRGWER